jgi:hypothetical protein
VHVKGGVHRSRNVRIHKLGGDRRWTGRLLR